VICHENKIKKTLAPFPASQGRSADFQSAVSQVFNLHAVRSPNVYRAAERAAGCNPSIQQIENLRYECNPDELDAAGRIVALSLQENR
jgi:hypothetical protein